jgi:hypothetical protein
MTQTVVLGPLYDPLITNKTVAFTIKDGESCGKIIELDPDSVYRVWVVGNEYYVEYEVGSGLDSVLKRLVVGEPPPGARLYIDCTIDDYHKDEDEFEEEKCKIVYKDEYGLEARTMLISIDEFFTRRLLKYMKDEFNVECPRGIVRKWGVDKVVMNPRKHDFDWLIHYITKHAGDYNSNKQEKRCRWLMAVALLHLLAIDVAKHRPRNAKDAAGLLASCKVMERIRLFKEARDPGVFKGLDRELRNLITYA